ncbi:MAG: hypothetical protein H7320_25110 [Ferruginibacter sp.]|nr:hypothetical protein [Ferruginibacter sp.]
MTDEQKQWITSTVPFLKEHGVLLTKHFYQDMFEHNPELKNINQYVFYNLPTTSERQEGILEGFLDINKIASLPQFPGTRYYVCGPSAFIQKQFQDLLAKGIEKRFIHFEEFGLGLLQLN